MASAPGTPGGVRIVGVVMALVFLAVASVGFTGDPFWLLSAGTKWIAVGALALVGVGLVATTVPALRRKNDR